MYVYKYRIRSSLEHVRTLRIIRVMIQHADFRNEYTILLRFVSGHGRGGPCVRVPLYIFYALVIMYFQSLNPFDILLFLDSRRLHLE